MIAKTIGASRSPYPMRAIPSVVMTSAELTARPRCPALVGDMSKVLTGIASSRRGDNREELKLEAAERNRGEGDGSSLQGELNCLRWGTLIIRPSSHSRDNVPAMGVKTAQNISRVMPWIDIPDCRLLSNH